MSTDPVVPAVTGAALITDYEDLTAYGLDLDEEQRLHERQNECTLSWITADGSPMSSIMSYVARDGKFWMTSASQRKRVPAMRRDPRCAITVSSTGADMGRNKTVTYKGIATIREDPATKAWFYRALAERLRAGQGEVEIERLVRFFDSPNRVIIEITPGLRVGYDSAKKVVATQRSVEAGLA